MQAQSKKTQLLQDGYLQANTTLHDTAQALTAFPGGMMNGDWNKNHPDLHVLLQNLVPPPGKKSFLVFKHNKYTTIPTEKIAFFYVKYEFALLVCFDRQEYSINYSLDQLQNLLSKNQYFRLNRQYLINFSAIKEVEHYFARKLLINPGIPAPDKLLVSKEKAAGFLEWLENR